MTGLDLLLAIAGTAVTVMVVVAMILITPRGQVQIDDDAGHLSDDSASDAEIDGGRSGPGSAHRLARPETSA